MKDRTYIASQVPALGPGRVQKVYKMRVARGLASTLVDSTPIREHLTWLHELGFSDWAIAAAAVLPQRTVWQVRTGVYDKTRIHHAMLLRNVTHVPTPAQADMLVPALGAARRIRALQAIGHTYPSLEQHRGWKAGTVRSACDHQQIRGATWLAIESLFNELSGTPGPSKLGVKRARAAGFPPPIAWEGVDIDHPDSTPILDTTAPEQTAVDEVLVARILAGAHRGPVPNAERAAVLDHAVHNRWVARQLANALRISHDAADRALVRHRAKLRQQQEAA